MTAGRLNPVDIFDCVAAFGIILFNVGIQSANSGINGKCNLTLGIGRRLNVDGIRVGGVVN